MSHGLRTDPSLGCSAAALKPNSNIWVLPSEIGPVARYSRMNSPSLTTLRGAQASAPRIVGWPATSTLFLMNVGTPSKNRTGPLGGLAAAAARLFECLVR